jgi:hypothetical protein
LEERRGERRSERNGELGEKDEGFFCSWGEERLLG